jgi:hypothetical protein
MLVHMQTKQTKKHEKACEGIELQFFTLQNFAQYNASCLKKQITPSPQNKSLRNQKPLATC